MSICNIDTFNLEDIRIVGDQRTDLRHQIPAGTDRKQIKRTWNESEDAHGEGWTDFQDREAFLGGSPADHSLHSGFHLPVNLYTGRKDLPHGRLQDRLYSGGWRSDRLRQTGADRIRRSASDDGGQYQCAASGIYGIGACSRQDAGEYFSRLQ